MFSHSLVMEAFKEARLGMGALIGKHPEIIRYGEGQLHFELASRLSEALRARKCLPWEDCVLLSDIRQAIELGRPIRDWELLDKIYRPDIVVLPFGSLNGANEPGICIEIKNLVTATCLRGKRYQKTDLREQVARFMKDDAKLVKLASFGDGKHFVGIKYVWHYHQPSWGEIPKEFTGDGWKTVHDLMDGAVIVREFIEIVRGKDSAEEILATP